MNNFFKFSLWNQRKDQLSALLLLISVFLWSAIDVLLKFITHSNLECVPEIIFFRNLIGLIFSSVYSIFVGEKIHFSLNRKSFCFHLLRVILSNISLGCLFYSLSILPLFEISIIYYTTPLVCIFFSGYYLEEKASKLQVINISITFLCVFVILTNKKSIDLDVAQLITIVGALSLGGMKMLTRVVVKEDSPLRALLLFYSLNFLLSGAIIPFWGLKLNASDIIISCLIGIVAIIGQFCVNLAFKISEVPKIISFEYTGIIWSLSFGYLFWNENPNLIQASGILIILMTSAIQWYALKNTDKSITS